MKTLSQIKSNIIETVCQYRILRLFLLVFDKKITYFYCKCNRYLVKIHQSDDTLFYPQACVISICVSKTPSSIKIISESKILIIFRQKSVINDMASFILKTVIIRICTVIKTDHLIKLSIVHWLCHDLI